MVTAKKLLKRFKSGSLALLFLLTQASLALTPFINPAKAFADHLEGYTVDLTSPTPPAASTTFTWQVSGSMPHEGEEISHVDITGCWVSDDIVSVTALNDDEQAQTTEIFDGSGNSGNPDGMVKVDSVQDSDLPLTISITFNQSFASNGTANFFVKTGGGSDAGFDFTPAGPNCEADTSTHVEVVKNLEPANDPGLFDLRVEGIAGQVEVTDVGDNGTTGQVEVDETQDISISEAAGTNTNLSDYTTSIVCRDENGLGSEIDTGNPDGTTSRGLTLEEDKLAPGGDIVCVITNTRILDEEVNLTVVKEVTEGSDENQEFPFTVTDQTGFSLSHEEEEDFDDIDEGEYTIAEDLSNLPDWSLDDVDCGQHTIDSENGTSITITLSEGDNVTCTFTNDEEQEEVDYCDPSQRPAGMSIAQWLASAQFDGADCFKYVVTERCGYFDVTVTGFPTMDGWAPYEAVYTTDGTVVYPASSFPANFTEDENGGSVEVSWYLVGPEKDYIAGTTLPNFWDETKITATVDTDCEEEPEKARVIVTKYEDLNRNGEFDPNEGEEVLSGWDMNLTTCENSDNLAAYLLCVMDDSEYSKTQTTGENGNDEGETIFTDLEAGTYYLSEVIQTGWNWSDTDCEYDELGGGEPLQDNYYEIYLKDGATVNCFVGNYQDLVIDLEKSNNMPEVTNGDVVTYELTFTVESGISYDTCVRDLLPAGFTFNGTWDVVNNPTVRAAVEEGSEDCGGVNAGGPSYGGDGPAEWYLGTVMAGETIRLTYEVVVGDEVTPGTYTNIAFATGNDCPAELRDNRGEQCEEVDSDFAKSDVELLAGGRGGQVLGASTTRTVLVETGDSSTLIATIVAAILLVTTFMAIRWNPNQKGIV